jgi:very-short-patch-repair endonuclease
MKYRNSDKELHMAASPEVFDLAHSLRKKPTPTEKRLWQLLRNNALGAKFRRQHPLHYYVADFYCHQLKLVIEVDGKIHETPENKERDEGRTGELGRLNIQVIRFTNEEILTDSGKVLSKIKEKIKDLTQALS